MIKAAIIGVSGFGSVHYQDLMREVEQDKLQIVAATIINQDEEPEKCARLRSLGCEIFTDYETMLNDFAGSIDLCMIPAGIAMHAPMSIAAMKAGANVFVEKPAAATVQEVEAMKETERETGRFTAVGYQHVYSPEVHEAKQRLTNGSLGDIKSIRCCALWPRPTAYYRRNEWAGRLKLAENWVLDSPFNNALAHMLNLMFFLAGPAQKESAKPKNVTAELYRANDIESTDTFCMRAGTTRDVPIFFAATHACAERFGPVLEVSCSRGQVVWDFNKCVVITADGRREEIPRPDNQLLRDRIMGSVCGRTEFSDQFICSLDIAEKQTLCANGAHESSPIHDIPADLISTVGSGDSTCRVIENIEAVIRTAYEEMQLFSELGASWAVPGREVDLQKYTAFSGGLTGIDG